MRSEITADSVKMPLPSGRSTVSTDDFDDIELPPLVIPKREGPECPFCGEPTMMADGDWICLDCNGGSYGPETG